MGMKAIAVVSCLFVLMWTAAACGGDDDGDSGETAQACGPIEESPVEEARNYHANGTFTAADYATPPAGGIHSLDLVNDRKVYSETPDLGAVVHNMEHGSTVLWTNALPADQQSEAEAAFESMVAKDAFKPGDKYPSLMMIENPDMDVPFAISAWGWAQKCESFDEAAVVDFLAEHYASGPEGAIACNGSKEMQAFGGQVPEVPACEQYAN